MKPCPPAGIDRGRAEPRRLLALEVNNGVVSAEFIRQHRARHGRALARAAPQRVNGERHEQHGRRVGLGKARVPEKQVAAKQTPRRQKCGAAAEEPLPAGERHAEREPAEDGGGHAADRLADAADLEGARGHPVGEGRLAQACAALTVVSTAEAELLRSFAHEATVVAVVDVVDS